VTIREVDEQPVDRRYRDALVRRQLPRVEPPDGVDAHAVEPDAPCGRDLDRLLVEPADAVELATGTSAEHAVGRKGGRHPLALSRERGLPDDVDPTMPPV